jgi:3-phosphoshikimate 1-carboxyvinyltransferase
LSQNPHNLEHPTEHITLHCPDRALRGTIALDGSKSISNRALIALALAGEQPERWLRNLSHSDDTRRMSALLGQTDSTEYDAGEAGTTFRFLTAYLALQPGEQRLTGSKRMLERPVGPLADALKALGADISFLGKEGYPPLAIGEWTPRGNSVEVAADVSSQFLSALLLVAPYLPEGLLLRPRGPLASRPYLEMTMRLMRHFGAAVEWQGEAIEVQPVGYQPRLLTVESDWSAASYWYAMAVFADELDLTLLGLQQESWQADAVLPGMMERFGVRTEFVPDGIRLTKTGQAPRPFFEQSFWQCPDIAQTLAVVCAGSGVSGLFNGLETLRIKETDRTAALRTELAKIGAHFAKLPARFSTKNPNETYWTLEAENAAHWPQGPSPRFATYQDHRMAMAFAALGMSAPVTIENPGVVSKSYPSFWEHLRQVGFVIKHEDL